MRSSKLIFYAAKLLLLCLALTGCRRSRSDIWDDTQSAGRHMSRGIRSLGGKQGDSRQICSRDQFYNQDLYRNQCMASQQEFVPLSDGQVCHEIAMNDCLIPQPRETPGDPGSSIPGLDAFRDPSTIPTLSGIFQNVHFDYNSCLIRGQYNHQIIKNIAEYMRRHPNVYLFVEGHCDERGPEAYNLALGANRSNAVRNMLIKEAVNPNNIFTISYGKERPLVFEHHEEAWARNRRVEFKVYIR